MGLSTRTSFWMETTERITTPAAKTNRYPLDKNNNYGHADHNHGDHDDDRDHHHRHHPCVYYSILHQEARAKNVRYSGVRNTTQLLQPPGMRFIFLSCMSILDPAFGNFSQPPLVVDIGLHSQKQRRNVALGLSLSRCRPMRLYACMSIVLLRQ